MADVNKDITLTLELDDQGVVTGIRRVNDEVTDLDTDGSSRARSFGTSMQYALGELAAQAAMELASQLGELISQGAELVNRGADIVETQNRFNTVFGQSSDVVRQFIEDQARMMGLTDARAKELLATAGAVVQGAGAAQDESAQMSVQIAQLAGDLASFNNVEPQRAFEAITSALTGEREQLKQFGIVIQEQMVQQRAMAMTGKETTSAITQQEEALASLQLMYEKAGPAVGDLERTADSAANTGRQASAAWSEVRDTFAEELVPVAAEVNEELLKLANSEETMATVRAAAKELSDQLVTGVQLASDFIQLFSENSEEIEVGAKVVGLLATAVGSYVAATKLQVLWTRRAVIAQQAATIAQRGLNTAMRLNPIGLVVSALTVVLPLMWRFRDAITDAAASVLDFSAKSIRGLQGVIDWMERLASRIPDAMATGPLAVFKTAVQGLDGAVDASASTMEQWAESLREVGEESKAGAEATMESAESLDIETGAVRDNTEAQQQNADAREEVASSIESVQKASAAGPVDIDTNVSTPDTLQPMGVPKLSTFESAEDKLDSALKNLAGSGDLLDRALEEVNKELEKTSDPAKRAGLQNLRERILNAKEAAEVLDRGMENINRSAKMAAVEGFVQLGNAIGDAQMTMADFGQAAQQILSDLAATIGRQLIAIGTSLLFVPGFQGQGATYVAAGTALTALSAAIQPSDSRGQSRGSGDDRGPSVPRMRHGGRVQEGQPVLVGDGPGGRITPFTELFVPDRSGTIVPRSRLNVSSGAASGGAKMGRLERKLDELKQAFEAKEFRLRGRDMVTQQARQQAIYDDAGIK